MFKGKQIKYLTETTNKLIERADKQDASIKDLEKLVNETNENLNQMSSDRFDSISGELKDFNEKVAKSSESLDKVQKDLGELEQVTNQISELKQTISENMTKFQNYRNELNTTMEKLTQEFSETNTIVISVKDELLEERKKVVESNEKLMKQEIMLTEKTGQVDKLDNELKGLRSLVGKLEEQRDTLEKEIVQVKSSRDLQYKELTRIQDEFNEYKKINEDQFSFSASVRKLLETTIEGKILLELQKKSPQTVDNLAEKLDETAVKVKQSINTLRELAIVKVDDEARTVAV